MNKFIWIVSYCFSHVFLFVLLKPFLFFPLSDVDDEDEESVDVDTSTGRFVRYQFTPAFLKLRTVGAT